MTQRERMMTALAGGLPDKIPWAPNIDHWLGVNTNNGTVPADLVGLSRNDIVRRIGGAIWARGRVLTTEYDEEVTVEKVEESATLHRTFYRTPVGTIFTVSQQAPDSSHVWFLMKHMVEQPEDLPVAKFLIEHTHYKPSYDTFRETEAAVGEDGIALVMFARCPYLDFMITLAGWETGLLLHIDFPREVEEVLEAQAEKTMEGLQIIAESPAQVAEFGDNTDGIMTSPKNFRKYCIPFYRRAVVPFRERGKLLGTHACGRMGTLLGVLPETELAYLEALVTAPMGNCTLAEARAAMRGKMAIQGGLPSSMLLPSVKPAEFRAYVEETLRQAAPGDGFVLGLGDNTPPDANFDLVRSVADIVAGFNG